MYVYCLFCVTQRCKVIAQLMEVRGANRAFSPQIIRKQRKQGKNIERCFDLLPGYVFIYSEEQLTDFKRFSGIDGIVRRVGRQEDGYALDGPDLDFAMRLLEKDGIVSSMKLCRVGDEVALTDDFLHLKTQFAFGGDVLTQDFTRGDVGQVVFLAQEL